MGAKKHDMYPKVFQCRITSPGLVGAVALLASGGALHAGWRLEAQAH